MSLYATIQYRGWLIFTGCISILGVPFWFSDVEQGYFYTFSSLVAAQVLFELGFGFVITQFVAHEIVGLREGNADNLSRVAHLLKFTNKCFNFLSVLFALSVGGVGYWFFSEKDAIHAYDWIVPWFALVLAAAFNLRYGARLALIEGAGEVGRVAQLRLKQSIIGNLLMWIALTFGAKLWAVSIVPMVAAIATAIWLSRHKILQDLYGVIDCGLTSKIDWRREYLPMQWRIALSWASGYLIFQAITPLTFAKLGPVEAGQIGLAFAIFNGVQTLGMSWINSRSPEFGQLIAKNNRVSLNKLFFKLFSKSTIIVTFGCGIVLLVALILNILEKQIAERIPGVAVLACLAVSTSINSVIFSMALYMRSHKEEPMLISSVFGGILILIGLYFGTSYSLLLAVFIYALITTVIGLPWTYLIFRKYYPVRSL